MTNGDQRRLSKNFMSHRLRYQTCQTVPTRADLSLTSLEVEAMNEVLTVNGWFADWLATKKKAAFYRVRSKIKQALSKSMNQ